MGNRLQDGHQRRPSPFAAAAIVLALVFAACTGEAVSTSTTALPTTTEVSATTIPEDRIDLDVGLPIVGSYAFFEVSLQAATIASIEPRTFLSESQDATEDRFLFVTLQIANRSNGGAAIFNQLPYSLVVDGIPQGRPVVVSGRSNVGLGPLAEDDSVLAFPIPMTAGFDEMVFVISEDDRIPTYLPLVGGSTETGFPIPLAVTAQGPAQGGASGCNQSLDVTVFGGEAAIDLVESDAAPSGYGSRRANLGERFLSLDLRILNNGGSRCGAGSTNYSPDSFELLVDGVPRSPVTFVSGAIASGAAEDLTVNFVYPADATTVEFAVGDEEGTLFLVPVDVSAVPAAPGE